MTNNKTHKDPVTTDTSGNTQELDEILKLHASYHYGGGREGELSDGKAKQAILDWHNKQVEEVLDRLEQVHRANPLWVNMTQRVVPLSAIEAERNKLKEVE